MALREGFSTSSQSRWQLSELGFSDILDPLGPQLTPGQASECIELQTLLQDHQLNALFVEGPHDIAVLGTEGVHNGTFIGSFGLKMHNTTIQVDTDEEGAMSGELQALAALTIIRLNLEKRWCWHLL